MTSRVLTDNDVEILVSAIDDRIDKRVASTLKKAVEDALAEHHICLFAEHERMWLKERAMIRDELEDDRKFIKSMHIWMDDTKRNIFKTLWFGFCSAILLFLYLVFEHKLWSPNR